MDQNSTEEPKQTDGTRLATFGAGVEPSHEEMLAYMRQQFEEIIAKRPEMFVIYANYNKNAVIAGAGGSASGLITLMQLGRLQVMDMLSRGMESGENG